MLINDFYKCRDIKQLENELSCSIVFNKEHSIFSGHFPGQPVVPGVCMMEIVKELLQGVVNKPIMLHSARNVKFLGFITPDMQPVMQINWKDTEGSYAVSASFKSESAVLFKLDGSYVPLANGQ